MSLCPTAFRRLSHKPQISQSRPPGRFKLRGMTKLTPEQEQAIDAMRSRQQAYAPPADALSAEERARIRAEETYRAQVRGEVAHAAQRQNAPSYWTGFILNLLVIGVGFFAISEPLWAVVWLLLAIVLNFSTGFLAWPIIAIGVLIHYRAIYARKYT